MTEFTGDKGLNFVIDHYKNIEAINEIYKTAKTKLPERVNLAIVDSIKGLENYFHSKKLICETIDGQIYWFDPDLYDTQAGLGLFLAFDYISSWAELSPEGYEPDRPFLYACYEPSGKTKADRKEDLNRWKNEIKKHKSSLLKKDIFLAKPDDDDPGWLVTYYIDKEVNIEVLKTPGELRKKVQTAVKNFTSTILPIIRKIAKT